MKAHDEPRDASKGQLLVYQAEDGRVKIDVRLEDESLWLTQKLMAELFQTTTANINIHLKNIFAEGEMGRDSVIKESLMTAADGKKYRTNYYNLDAIISVGYRVRSAIATRFRIWATQRLREYIVKGFVLDDERLKNPDHPFDYFEELLRRIQDIRTSERRFYQKITDIYATSIDYDPTQPESIEFFQTVQNKMHWAITAKTAAEIINTRADSAKPNMGLTARRGAKVRKHDVAIAKNYLDEHELAALNNLVEQYLLFAEGQAMRRVPMYMRDWIDKLHAFLSINDRDILMHAGRISHRLAKQLAKTEYEKFNRERVRQADAAGGDFERAIKHLPPPPRRPNLAQRRGVLSAQVHQPRRRGQGLPGGRECADPGGRQRAGDSGT